MSYKEAGERCRTARGDRSQSEMAEAIGCSSSMYSQVERGDRRPGLEILASFCEETGIQATAWYPELEAIRPHIPKKGGAG